MVKIAPTTDAIGTLADASYENLGVTELTATNAQRNLAFFKLNSDRQLQRYRFVSSGASQIAQDTAIAANVADITTLLETASQTVNQSVTESQGEMNAAGRRMTAAGVAALKAWAATVADTAEIDATWNTGANTLDFTDGATTEAVPTETAAAPISVQVDLTWFTDADPNEDTTGSISASRFKEVLRLLGGPVFLTGTNEEMEDRRLHVGPTASKPVLTLATGNADHYSAFFDTDKRTYTFYVSDPADDTKLIESTAAFEPAKNALVYPVGNFTALAVNDSGKGNDGAVYKLPTVDDLQITLPAKADMNAAEGIYRVRVSGDWAALATQTTVLSFIDDTANGVDMGTGLPDDGNEWLDLVFDAANDKWIATSGGDVTLTQVVPSYVNQADVPATIRLFLATGAGDMAEGIYRKEVADDSLNFIG